MKTRAKNLFTLVLSLGVVSAYAQMGGMGGPPPRGTMGPQISSSMAKLFGNNSAFSATMENQIRLGSGEKPMTMVGKIAFDSGKSRFEMNMSGASGSQMPPQAPGQMKDLGMETIVTISRPDKKMAYIVYPGLQAYAETPIQDPDAAKADSDFKMETTELGKETIDGHPCVKSKVVITNDKGEKHESTVWKATDLKDFPVKMEITERGQPMTISFKDVNLSKPDALQFDPPSDFKMYSSREELMQQEIMKRMGGGMPPGR
jgi:outer membrane lipoprotein-sorting protein